MDEKKMVHLRMPEMTRVYFRECGRKDPLWDLNAYCNGVERMGEWGLTTELETAREAARRIYNEVDQQWIRDRKNATINGLPHAEPRPEREIPKGIPAEGKQTFDQTRHVRIKDKALWYFDGDNSVELARWVGHRKDMSIRIKATGEVPASLLLNGDGFDDALMQRIQAELRRRAHVTFRANRVMVIPYMALNAAQIDIDTIQRVDTTQDGQDTVFVPIAASSVLELGDKRLEEILKERKTRLGEDSNSTHQTYLSSSWVETTFGGRKWRYNLNGYSYGKTLELNTEIRTQLQIWHQPEDGELQWCSVASKAGKKGPVWQIETFVHRLGSTVFTGRGPDGDRHRFLSSFDTNEPEPLYFLAQLPDKGRATNYIESLRVLSPPIVHQARDEGRMVYRQGDVFFIETNVTSKQLLERKARIGQGLTKTRRPVQARNIYGTGHIATHVARQPNGVTFVKGTAEHFPAFTEPGRAPEHRAIKLEPLDKWFLCVRNTVPRSASTQDSSPTAADAEAAVKEVVKKTAAAKTTTTKSKKEVTSGTRSRSKTAV